MKVEGMSSIFAEAIEERHRSVEYFKGIGVNIHEFDKSNTRNDWISYITTYAGRASEKVHSNERGGFRANMLKVINLAVAAIQAYDEKYC